LKADGVYAGDPACAPIITGDPIRFGTVRIGSTAIQSLNIYSQAYDCGDRQMAPKRDRHRWNCLCLLGIQDLSPSGLGFTLVNSAPFTIIHPGTSADVPIAFAPTTIGAQTATLTISLSGDPGSNPNDSTTQTSTPTYGDINIPIFGTGIATTVVHCPPDRMTRPGSPVTVSVAIDPLGNTVTGIDWSVTSGPPHGVGTPHQWTPSPPNAVTETFLPLAPGLYDIKVAVSDNTDETVGCTFTVTATRTPQN
jgi:hypothetical protein